ncbi:MAG TPA: response regulator [Polyangiaceae bacterium]|jgi:PAS domain S-box-containing protein|nr:response regulator [Polyangiaceae bacterium]
MQAPAKERVLVVDDEPQVLVALEDLLSDRFTVFKTATGEDALRLMEQEQDIAVVITDQRMPRMSGDELLAKLSNWTDTQRILLTGFADLSAVIRAVNDGKIFSYVTKPWSPEDLQLKVQSAVDHFRLSKELAAERQLLHDLMDNIPDGIYFKDLDLRFRRANRAFATMIGASAPGAVVRQHLEEVAAAAGHADASDAEERRVVSGGAPVLDVVRAYERNGVTHWLSETKAPVRDANGRVVGLVGIARDVTERVATQEALRQSEEQLRKQTRVLNSILEGMGDGVIAVDRAGQALLFNRRAQQILGVPAQTKPRADWTEAYGVHHKDGGHRISGAEDPLLRAMQGDPVPLMEVGVDNENVSAITVAVTTTSLVDDENRIAGGIALLRDVTQQRNLEHQLLQSQKMEAVGRLAAGVAHDFNNLLAVIICYGELTMESLEPESPYRNDLRELIAAGERAAGLTRQLLAFSRRRVIQAKVLQLNEVVSDVEKMLRRIIGEDVGLVTRLTPTLGMVHADPGQIEQIIVNLVVNARDAMPSGGKLTIETRNVTLSDDQAGSSFRAAAGDFVMLAVTDTGMGMDAQTRARIFEPFFTTKDVGKGTGLGLSTVHGIVEQSGGHIWVYSEPGQGTTFKVYFPQVEDDGARRQSRAEHSPLPTGTETILLVEDDDAVRRVALRILRGCGYNVLEARRAADARRICREMGPAIDLLLTDVVMPETSGFELAAELSNEFPKMRVLHMSGYPDAAVVHDGLLAEGTPYVEKPFSPASLAEKVRTTLEAS